MGSMIHEAANSRVDEVRENIETAPTAGMGVAVPMGLERHIGGDDRLSKAIDAYLSRPLERIGIKPKFKDIPDITGDMEQVHFDFPDNKLLNEPAIVLQRLPVRDVVELGRKTIPMLSFGFSQQGIASLLSLAYQLKDSSNHEEYAIAGTYARLDDKTIDEFSATVYSASRELVEIPATADIKAEAMAYAYIAASTLRMFTRSDDNYKKAFDHILIGFSRFYGIQIPFSAPVPSAKALATISHSYSQPGVYKNTLYRILYLGGNSKVSLGLRRFLYEQHLTNTGMHIVSIFCRLSAVLNCKASLLLSVIETNLYKSQISALSKMIELIMKNDPEHERAMWRYGRIFDDHFMSPLRTKSCAPLTYTLAFALKSLSAESNANILSIVQFEELGPEIKRRCEAVALRIVKRVYHKMIGDNKDEIFLQVAPEEEVQEIVELALPVIEADAKEVAAGK